MRELFSIVMQPCYNVITYVQEVTVLRTGCAWSNMSADPAGY